MHRTKLLVKLITVQYLLEDLLTATSFIMILETDPSKGMAVQNKSN